MAISYTNVYHLHCFNPLTFSMFFTKFKYFTFYKIFDTINGTVKVNNTINYKN
jgi:hypothetical protein